MTIIGSATALHEVGLVPTPVVGAVGRPSPPSSGFRGMTARHPVGCFLLLAFAVGYPVMFLPVLADHGVISDAWMPVVAGVDTERVASVLLVFAALLPAVLWVTWAAEGREGLRALARRMVQWRIGVGSWRVVLEGCRRDTGARAPFGDTVERSTSRPSSLPRSSACSSTCS